MAATPNQCIATAYKHAAKGQNAGAAYYYKLQGNKWQLQQKIMPQSLQAYALFGSAVAMTQQSALISAVGDTQNGFQSGAVYAFTYHNAKWQEQQKITSPLGAPNEEFGNALDIDNHVAIIGAWGNATQQSKRTGAAYIYRYDASQWIHQQTIFAPDGQDGDRFGWSVSLNGNILAIGSPGNDESGKDMGAVYIYTYTGGKWIFAQKITPQGGIHGAAFGIKVIAAPQGQIWISAEKVRTQGGTSGAVYSYLPNGNSQLWVANPQPATQTQDYTNARYGAALAVKGSMLAVGAYLAVNGQEQCGNVAVYHTDGKTMLKVAANLSTAKTELIKIYPNPVSNSYFNIESDAGKIKDITIVDQSGNLLSQQTANSCHSLIYTQNVLKGVYFVKITLDNGEVFVHKLIVL